MPVLHKNILDPEIHEVKGFAAANNGDAAWRNEVGNWEFTDQLLLPGALEFVDASVAPPTTNAGDIYVLSTGGSVNAGWGGSAGLKDWVRYDGTNWNAITPQKSTLCYNKDDDFPYAFDGVDWQVVGASSFGAIGISDSSGEYTFYSTLALAVAAAISGETIEFFSDVTETSSTKITISKDLNINLNGHTYLDLYDADKDNIDITSGSTVSIKNGTIKRVKTTTATDSVLRSTDALNVVDLSSLLIIGENIQTVYNIGSISGGTAYHTGSGTASFRNDGKMVNMYFEAASFGYPIGSATAESIGCTFIGNSFSMLNNGTVIDCYLESNTSGNGIAAASTSVTFIDCEIVQKGTGVGIEAYGSATFEGCNIKSESGNAMNIIEPVIKDCHIRSESGNYTLFCLGSPNTVKIYDSIIESGTGQPLYMGPDTEVYNSTLITESTTKGVITIADLAGSNYVIDCHLETASTTVEVSSMATTNASKFVYWGKNKYKGGNGSTTFGTNGNSQTSTEDTLGNMQID
jgi:hypothetical protein